MSHAESRIARLIAMAGPEWAAELSNPSAADDAAINAFGKRIAGMTDHELRSEFGASDDLVGSLRELQATCGF